MFEHVPNGDMVEAEDVVTERFKVCAIVHFLDLALECRLVQFEKNVLGDGF